VDVRKY